MYSPRLLQNNNHAEPWNLGSMQTLRPCQSRGLCRPIAQRRPSFLRLSSSRYSSISALSVCLRASNRFFHFSERFTFSSEDMLRGSSFFERLNLLVTCSSFALAGECSPDFLGEPGVLAGEDAVVAVVRDVTAFCLPFPLEALKQEVPISSASTDVGAALAGAGRLIGEHWPSMLVSITKSANSSTAPSSPEMWLLANGRAAGMLFPPGPLRPISLWTG